MDIATATTRIAEIDAILGAGIVRARMGDRFVEYDFAELRKERNRLQTYLNGGQLRVGRMNPRWSGG